MNTFKLLMMLLVVFIFILVFSPLIVLGLIANFCVTSVVGGWTLGDQILDATTKVEVPLRK